MRIWYLESDLKFRLFVHKVKSRIWKEKVQYFVKKIRKLQDFAKLLNISTNLSLLKNWTHPNLTSNIIIDNCRNVQSGLRVVRICRFDQGRTDPRMAPTVQGRHPATQIVSLAICHQQSQLVRLRPGENRSGSLSHYAVLTKICFLTMKYLVKKCQSFNLFYELKILKHLLKLDKFSTNTNINKLHKLEVLDLWKS